MKRLIADIVGDLKRARSREAKLAILKRYDEPTFREFCAYWVNPNINWLLPKGTPEYKENEPYDAEEALWSQVRKLYIFVEGGAPNLNPIRREKLFIDTLEMLHPEDAKVMIQLKDKTLKGLDESVVKEAWPGFLTY
tara:strand:+ start:2674 stop:3084 length:411 start_codon:yes stop_codon:yes gene_type:complete